MRTHSLWIVVAGTVSLVFAAGCAKTQPQPRVQVNPPSDVLEVRLARAQTELESAKVELREAIAEVAIMQQAVEQYAERNARAEESRDAIRMAIEPVTNTKNSGTLSPDMHKRLAVQIRELAELERQRENVRQILQAVARDPEMLEAPNRQMAQLSRKIVALKAEIRQIESLLAQASHGGN